MEQTSIKYALKAYDSGFGLVFAEWMIAACIREALFKNSGMLFDVLVSNK